MPPTFQRFQRGQLFRPNQQTVNGMVAAAESYQFHARDPGDAGNDFYSPSYQFEGIYIQVRNDSGSALPRFGVGGLNGPLVSDSQELTTFQEQPRFSVVTPAATIHTGKFCILLEPLAAAAIGPALLVGTCMVQIRLPAAPPACNWSADVADGQTAYLRLRKAAWPKSCGRIRARTSTAPRSATRVRSGAWCGSRRAPTSFAGCGSRRTW